MLTIQQEWVRIETRERLYDYASRDFETVFRNWTSLDTKASQLIVANAVLLGLVVGGAGGFLLIPTDTLAWRVVIVFLLLSVFGLLIASFLSALATCVCGQLSRSPRRSTQ